MANPFQLQVNGKLVFETEDEVTSVSLTSASGEAGRVLISEDNRVVNLIISPESVVQESETSEAELTEAELTEAELTEAELTEAEVTSEEAHPSNGVGSGPENSNPTSPNEGLEFESRR